MRHTEQTRHIRANAVLVVDYLRTRGECGVHSDRYVFEDDKLLVVVQAFDRRAPVIAVRVKIDGDCQGVFGASGPEGIMIDTFRPGRWITYLEQLAEKAEQVRLEREAELRRAREARFLPIDDSDIFGQAEVDR